MKYPIGIQTFSKIRQGDYIYVDKTMYIRELISGGDYYFLSRPRRFGKSLLLSTIEAYFKGQKELFDGLAIAQTENDWIQHPIVRIDFASMETTSTKCIVNGIMLRLKSIANESGLIIPDEEWSPSTLLGYIVETLHRVTGRGVVVLIDEYDKGIIETLNDVETNSKTIDVLRPFFSVLKSHDEHIRFAFITGVSRFHNTTIFSGFNNPNDISLVPKYSSICGITNNELICNFTQGIRDLAFTHQLSEEKTIEILRDKYDGYRFTMKDEHVFNPFSILNALSNSMFDDFWVMSGTSRILVDYLRASQFSLNDLTNRWVTGDQLGSTYSNEDPLSLFFQTGYLTIADYDGDGSYLLRMPNQEVQAALVRLLIPEFVETNVGKEISEYQLRQLFFFTTHH